MVIQHQVNTFETPFNWKLREIEARQDAAHITDRLNEKEEEVTEPWVHVCVNFVKAYLAYEEKEIIKSIEILKDTEQLIKSSNNAMVERYRLAFLNVYYASRAYLAEICSTQREVEEHSLKVIPLTELSNMQRSAMYAIKANVFLEFGVYGSKEAVNYAKEAIRLYPTEGDWHFLMGKLLSRLRHFERDHLPSADEKSYLQTAHQILKTPRSAIFLANCYLEESKTIHFEARKNMTDRTAAVRNRTRALGTEARDLILYALKENADRCVHIMIRIAFACSSLPPIFEERNMAEEVLEKALEKSPLNAMANKLAGDLCLRKDKPLYDKALKHYEIAASRNVLK